MIYNDGKKSDEVIKQKLRLLHTKNQDATIMMDQGYIDRVMEDSRIAKVIWEMEKGEERQTQKYLFVIINQLGQAKRMVKDTDGRRGCR